jgi:hypothetical protein
MNVSDSAAQTHDDAIGHGAIYRGFLSTLALLTRATIARPMAVFTSGSTLTVP